MEIYGFKSFADKVQIKFESGVTGIVGPNGCGKSNVADSIRWVLGEQSAKALRGSSMQDVIFNGTEKRKPQSFAEVSLCFDNTEKIFNVDYDEVVLSRKLYRSGESEYAINKTPCRLKDVHEILRDSGMGRESYSIIGQGRIDELLSAKPEDRRAVFEEAAGISKLKNRKLEALKKLANTEDNLTRISDIIHELEIQIGPLSSQAETAKKYLEIRDKLKILDVNNYIYQYDTSNTKKEEINSRLNGIIEEINLKTSELDATVDDYNITAQKIEKADDEISALRDELLTLTVGLEKQAGESKLLQEKMTLLKRERERLAGVVNSLMEEKESLEKQIGEDTSAKSVAQTTMEELSDKIENLALELASLDEEIGQIENKAEEDTQKLVESLGKLGDVKAQISGLQAEAQSIRDRLASYSTKKENLALEFEESMQLLNDTNSRVNELAGKIKEKQEEQKLTRQDGLKFAYKLAGVEEDIVDIKSEHRSLESKIALMKEMQKENEGYVQSVKKLLTEAKDNSTLGGKFVNVVAKMMSVPEEYQTAIDMALGSSIQNIVTKNEDDAKYVIQYLKDNNFGRATFLPLTSVKPRRIADEFVGIIKSTSGARGVASELIEYDKQYDMVFASLLGSTVIVNNMDVAVSLAKRTRYSFKIVTLDGDVINPAGTITGGSKKAQGVSLLGREREIVEAESRLKALETSKQEKEAELEEMKAEQEEYNKQIEEIDAQIHSLEIEQTKESESLANLRSTLNFLKTQEQEIEEDEEKAKSDQKAIEERLEAYARYQEELNSGAVDSGAVKNPEIYMLKQKRASVSEELTELKVKKASADGNLVALENAILNNGDKLEETIREIREQKFELQKHISELENLQSQFEKVVDKTAYDANLHSLEDVRNMLAGADSSKKMLSKRLSDLSEQKLVLTTDIQRANDRKYKEESGLAKIDTDIEVLQERVWEEYGLTYASAQEFRLETHNLQEGLEQSGKLKKQLQSLGNVNVNAIEMLSDVNSRYSDMSAQRDDLVSAETDLNKIITSLTAEMEVKFKTEFNKINTNFQGVFRELFGGGRAELRLEDPENPLECGIEIAAEPTGKKLQNITLLSGGERALTAIAILFAILKLKPMPFCLLDEIEAALDDANVERYAKYLKRFSNYTQFIVITHRKPTMELADNLYGVTMEERGVSKVVSVQLSEAVKTAK